MAFLQKLLHNDHLSCVQDKLKLILGKKNVGSEEITTFLDDLIALFFYLKKKDEVLVNAQVN